MRGERSVYKCKSCGAPFSARTADRKRGWARFCSKHCKAVEQTRRTGRGRPTGGFFCDEGPEGWDGHKTS